MFDETDRLAEDERLFLLLSRYAEAGLADREAWRDRVMDLDGAADDLVTLHGELIAYDWVEQNSGVTPVLERGRVAGCYRVTAAGLRAFKQRRL